MAKKKGAKPESKSEFLRKVLSKNPNLDYHQVSRRWTKAGHTGDISNALYYQVRAKLGIKTEWAWVRDSGPEDVQKTVKPPERQNAPNADLIAVAKEQLHLILGFYKLFEANRPVMLFDLENQQILAYPYEEYKATLSERSQIMLTAQYEKAVAEHKVVVFVRDNATRRLTSMSFDYE